MKRNIIIILLSITLVFSFFYLGFSRGVEYEILTIDDAPVSIQTAIQENKDKLRFSIFEENNITYIYYKSDHFPNEYITTDLELKMKGRNYIVSATVTYAVNDGNVNYDRLIKFDKVLDKGILLTEKDKH